MNSRNNLSTSKKVPVSLVLLALTNPQCGVRCSLVSGSTDTSQLATLVSGRCLRSRGRGEEETGSL